MTSFSISFLDDKDLIYEGIATYVTPNNVTLWIVTTKT